MSPREVFGIIVRSIGLCTVLYGLFGIGASILMKFNFSWGPNIPFFDDVMHTTGVALMMGAITVAIGLCLLFGATRIVQWCYGVEETDRDTLGP